jgi:hypothetical protein
MPKLPAQRGFYDDIRGFQRKDVRVRTDAFAPTPGEQFRRQVVWGVLFLGLCGAAAAAHIYYSNHEAREVPKASKLWEGAYGVPRPVPGEQPKH